MKRPLGCLTFSALVAAVLVVAAILGATVVTGNGIFSPGALSAVHQGTPIAGVTSHADLEGHCDACHAPALSGVRMGDRCLVCHTQVKQEITTKGGLHGRLLATTTSCRDCHTEHRGETAAVTLADPRVFPHEQTGYSLAAHPLRGKGGGFGCRDCHPGSPLSFSAPTCAGCHETLDKPFMTEHVATFGTTCLGCHDGSDAYGKSFEHKTYPLTGGHAQAKCAGCHQQATTVAALQATSTECISCHKAKDIHEGRLGTSCGECHTSETWADATINHDRTRFTLVGQHIGAVCESCHVDRHWTGIGQTCRSCHDSVNPHGKQFPGDCASCHAATGWKDVTFDHATTRFALSGGHAKPACAACHANGRYVGTLTTCVGCHAADDQHKGSFGKDCASCHKTTTWTGAKFDHSKAAFALTGAHQSVTCQKCHVGGVYKGTPKTCAGCHTKPSSHTSGFGINCAGCHSTKAWKPAKFDHSKAAFALTGAHQSVTCQKCHVGGVYKGTPKTCAGCHTKPSSHTSGFGINCAGCHSTKAWKPAKFDHSKAAFALTGAHQSVTCQKCHVGGVYKGTPKTCAGCHTKPSSHTSGFGINCAGCHSTKAWKPAKFDHSKAAFALTGAHQSVTCQKCHVGGVYKGTPKTCAGCHTKPSSHTSGFGINCAGCHSTKAWKPAKFDHSKAAFALTGAHQSVTCQKCHVGGVYKGTPKTCAGCHTKPSSHTSGFGINCAGCHSTKAWKPASYNGPHTFPRTHQGADGVCATCHPNSWPAYSCAKCHSNSKMNDKHKDVSGFSLTTCAKCHPTGKGGD